MSAILDGFTHFAGGVAHESATSAFTRQLGRLLNASFPYRFLEVDQYNDLYLQQYMHDDEFKKFLLMEGFSIGDHSREKLYVSHLDLKDFQLFIRDNYKKDKVNFYTQYLRSLAWLPDIPDIILFLQRKWITVELAHHWLKRHGMQEWDIRRVVLEQIHEFPTVQDLIQFSVRHGFEPDILDTFGYAKEIPTIYREWADKIGLGGSSKVPINNATDETGQPIGPHQATWAEQHWFAHWILPSLGDAYEMLHRLYPDSRNGPSPDWQQGLDFTPELLTLFQRAQDIPQYWRQRLQAISYLPFSRVDVRRMYNLRVIDEKEVYHSYRAQGYNDDKAQKLLTYAQKARNDIDIKTELWPKAEKICELRNLGILDDQTALTYTDKLNIPRVDVQDYFANCDLNMDLERLKNALKAIKRAFIKGIVDEDNVRTQLDDLGMNETGIQNQLDEWTLLQQYEFKEDNAKEAQTWYESGIISNDEFVERLQNLKISQGSILHMVEYSNVKIAEKVAANDLKLQKELLAKAKEFQKEQKAQTKELQKEQSDYLKKLLASSTQANLKKWWKNKLIPEDLLNERLSLLNYSDDDIERWKKAYGG